MSEIQKTENQVENIGTIGAEPKQLTTIEKFRADMKNARFCYAKEGGQGFVDKSECACDCEKDPCQAKKDHDRFHASFEHISGTRSEMIQELKPKFYDSQWFKDNVIE